MRQNYQRASRVLFWLGQEEDQSDQVMKYLKALNGLSVRAADPYRKVDLLRGVPELLSRPLLELV